MPVFSPLSRKRLDSCDPRLIKVMDEAIKYYDFAVMCGYRGKEDQDRAFAEGKSKLRYPASKHNTKPSMAVDLAPWPSLYGSDKEFYRLAGVIQAVSQRLGINVKWGGEWVSFKDLPHFELVDYGR